MVRVITLACALMATVVAGPVHARTIGQAIDDAAIVAQVKAKLTDSGFEVVASDGPALDRYVREQYERWTKFVNETGLKVSE